MPNNSDENPSQSTSPKLLLKTLVDLLVLNYYRHNRKKNLDVSLGTNLHDIELNSSFLNDPSHQVSGITYHWNLLAALQFT